MAAVPPALPITILTLPLFLSRNMAGAIDESGLLPGR